MSSGPDSEDRGPGGGYGGREAPETAGAKRPWQRPRVLFREPLEAVAVACVPTVEEGGPGKPDTIQCISPSS